jgi:hypothetical protein
MNVLTRLSTQQASQIHELLVQRKPGALRNGALFTDMPEPLKMLKLGLMRHDGGDKVMA